MKQIMNVFIEIESNCTHTARNIEEALNFFWGSDGTFKVSEAVEHSVQADGTLPSVEEVICPICQSIVRLYNGNKVGMHTPHSNVNEPICKMVGSEITPRQ